MSLLKRGKPLKGQSREIVYNVHQFMQNEAQRAKNQVFSAGHFQSVMERTATATGISRKTVAAILKEKDCASSQPSTSGPSFRTPKKGRRKLPYRANLDDFDYQVIRRKIYDFHLVEKQVPTVKALVHVLKRDINFSGGRETLRKIIKELGFKFKKTETNRKILAEKDEVRLLRIKYLRKIKKYRNEGRNIVYGDETYVHTSSFKESAWTDSNGKGFKKPVLKGQRLIIVHAGGSNGFVPGALLIYESSQSTGDYHNEMNYEKWIKNQLIPNLPPQSVFVIDNAAYHNTLREKPPNSDTRKAEMQGWLNRKNINFDPSYKRPELYEIIKKHKNDFIEYSIDKIMEEHGHIVLRLPPYHPEFNPIENIWVQVKGHVSKYNVKMNVTEIIKLLNEKFSSIGVEAWQRVVEHAVKCENEYMTLEDAIDEHLDQFVINTGDSSSSSSSSDEDAEHGISENYTKEHKSLIQPEQIKSELPPVLIENEYESLKSHTSRDLSALANMLERTSEPTGVSQDTVKTILNSRKRSADSESEPSSEKRHKPCVFDEDVRQSDELEVEIETLKLEFYEDEDYNENGKNFLKGDTLDPLKDTRVKSEPPDEECQL